MATVEFALYQWIRAANEKQEILGLPPGLIEDSIALLCDKLGRDYLQRILVSSSEPITVFDSDVNPLRKWLKSALIEQHIVQTLELAAYIRAFNGDPALSAKMDKLKRDRFWPVFFELAMAARMKAACHDSQCVTLAHENEDARGDFTLSAGGTSTPCECSRLGHSPQVNEPHILGEHITKIIGEVTDKVPFPLIFKIRSTDALTGQTYNLVLRLLRKCRADIRGGRLPTTKYEGGTMICCGELTPHSEAMPFAMVSGVVTNVTGTDWDVANSIKRVPAADEDELVNRFKVGERFHEFEAVRIFMKFGPHTDAPDYFSRLSNKLKKKLKQTKVNQDDYGKIVAIEVPFDPRSVDESRLNQAVAEAARQSRNTLAVILAHREANPHYRYHYSVHGSLNKFALMQKPELIALFERFRFRDTRIDPITQLPYQKSWEAAFSQARARRVAETE